MHESSERAWVEVDLGALQRNAVALQRHSGVPVLPMVKADAYGLGVAGVVPALEALNPWGFGVATVQEGRELRDLGITRPVLVFTPLLGSEMAEAHAAKLSPTLGDLGAVREWSRYGGPWHLAVDTGMSRAGLSWRTAAKEFESWDLPRGQLPQGVWTHFHSAELDDGSREEQEQRFTELLIALKEKPRVVHTDNSAAIVRRGKSDATFNRPGVFLYGAGSGAKAKLQPEPVVTLAARVVELRTIEPGDSVSYEASFHATRKTRIATIAAGYADGYPRALSNVGKASVRGKLVPIAGTVTMDMIMLDVSDIECEVGDVAVLIGRDGANELSVEAVAAAGKISHYELLTGLRSRIQRRYFESSSPAAPGSARQAPNKAR